MIPWMIPHYVSGRWCSSARQLRELARLLSRDRAGLAEPAASMGATPADAARDLDGGHMALPHHAAAVAGHLLANQSPATTCWP
jgi:hypothetical protein